MAMDEMEQRMYGDIVKLVNRTDSTLEFTWDSKLHSITGKGNKNIPRFIAEHGVMKYATSFDGSGLVTSSLFGISGDDMWPTTPLSKEEVLTLENSDKFGDEVVDGSKIVKKTKIELKQPKENFAVNNL